MSLFRALSFSRRFSKSILCTPSPMACSERWVSHYSGPETSIEDICDQLVKYEGGKVDLHQDDSSGIATITINHPERRNALSGKMMTELWNIVNILDQWKNGKGIVVHSVGEIFCSGGDLNTVRQIANPADGFKMSTLMHRTLTQLHQLPLVSVTLVQGKALGGGSELCTATDFRLFTKKGEIGFVQGRMGVVTGWGGGTRLVQLLGQHKALDLLLTSRQVPASEAVEMGLANGIVNSSDLSEAVEEAKIWLQEKLNHAPQVIHALKHIVATARAVPYEMSLENERRVFAMLWGGEANKKALEQNIKHK